MKNHFVISILLSSATSMAQPYFSKNYHVSYNDGGWNILVINDGLLMLSASICEGGATCTGLIKTNFIGEPEWLVFIDSLRVSTQNNILADNTNILLAMHKGGEWEAQNIRLLSFNQYGDLINYRRIGDGLDYELPLSMNWYNNNLVLGIDERIPGNDSVTTHMAFYSPSFDSLKTFQFVRDLGGTSREFRQTSDGDLLHLRTVNKLNGKEAHVIKTDTNGNIIWKHVLEKSDWNFATDLALLPDDGVAVHWNKQITVWSEDTFEFVDYVVRLDEDGTEIWRHYLYSPYLLRRQLDHIFATQNGDIVGCGYYNFLTESGDSSFYGAWIFRMDGNGNLKWQRDIADTRYPSGQFLYAGAEMENGDLVFTGSIGFPGPPEGSNVWLLRTDSMGCLNPGCGDFQEIVPVEEPPPVGEEAGFSVYPNPAQDEIIIAYPIEVNEALFAMYDQYGRLKKSLRLDASGVLKISARDLPNGLYFLSISNHDDVLFRSKLMLSH